MSGYVFSFILVTFGSLLKNIPLATTENSVRFARTTSNFQGVENECYDCRYEHGPDEIS